MKTFDAAALAPQASPRVPTTAAPEREADLQARGEERPNAAPDDPARSGVAAAADGTLKDSEAVERGWLDQLVAPESRNKQESEGPDRKEQSDHDIGSAMEQDDDLSGFANNIAGHDDRMHYLAMVATAGIALLRAPTMAAPSLLPAVRAQSKAECTRRCGSDGFCDPSSELGCGGEHCGRQYFDV